MRKTVYFLSFFASIRVNREKENGVFRSTAYTAFFAIRLALHSLNVRETRTEQKKHVLFFSPQDKDIKEGITYCVFTTFSVFGRERFCCSLVSFFCL